MACFFSVTNVTAQEKQTGSERVDSTKSREPLYSDSLKSAYADEDIDEGVSPVDQPKKGPVFHSATPSSIPGGKLISTKDLALMLDSPDKPLVFDVLARNEPLSLPTATYISSNIGFANLTSAEKSRLQEYFTNQAKGDKNKAMVFYCLDRKCWLSYNSALEAIKFGFTNVYWYRGGIESWKQAGLPFYSPKKYNLSSLRFNPKKWVKADDFYGLWEGRWSQSFLVRMNISSGVFGTISVDYDYEDKTGEDMKNTVARGFFDEKTSSLTFGAVSMQIDQDNPDLAFATGNFDTSKRTTFLTKVKK